MTNATLAGGSLTLADDFTITRMGYGAMQFGSIGVTTPPDDRAGAIAVLREVVRLGITHIDTSDFYGAGQVNLLIKDALHPYPTNLRIVTKVGFRSDHAGNWMPALDPDDLVLQVRENMDHLRLDALDAVNLRVDVADNSSIAAQFGALAKLQDDGLIRQLGVSNVSAAQLAEARTIAPVVFVQNNYNLANRGDDELVDLCAAEGIAFASFFPLGGFSPLQSSTLTKVAADLGVSTQQVALAWLLQRSATTVLIPGTTSIAHLHDNLAAASLELPAEAIAELDSIAGQEY